MSSYEFWKNNEIVISETLCVESVPSMMNVDNEKCKRLEHMYVQAGFNFECKKM